MQVVVNGYVCQTSCDVALAKKGIDPAHPHDPPGTAKKVGATGNSSSVGEEESPTQVPGLGENQPAASGTLGTNFNAYM
jgi:hypothetical protein